MREHLVKAKGSACIGEENMMKILKANDSKKPRIFMFHKEGAALNNVLRKGSL